MSFDHPYIEWTDEIGAARLTLLGYAFQNWTPDQQDVGDAEVAVGSGRTYFFAYRVDHLAYFEIANIANTELVLAMRLKSWLVRGGAIVITTKDSEDHVYNACMAPLGTGTTTNAALPALTLSDNVELEYMLALTVKNIDTPDPRPMPYTPVAIRRLGALTLSPSSPSLAPGGSPVTVTATLTDSGGAPLDGIVLEASSSDTGQFTVSPAFGTTDASGHVAFSLTPVASSGSADFTVSTGALSTTIAVPILTYGLDILPIFWPRRDSLVAHSNLDPITALADASPSAWNLVTEVAAPKWDSTTLGGSVKYDGSLNEALKNLSFDSLASVTGMTIFLVARASGGVFFSLGSDTSHSSALYGYMASGFFQFTDGGLAWRAKYSFTPDGADHLFELVYAGAGAGNSGKVKQYLDGTLQTPTFDGTIPSTLTIANNGIILGRGLNTSYLTGNIAEPLIYAATLSDADRATVHAGLAAKYPSLVIA